jgi:hypothetical protein
MSLHEDTPPADGVSIASAGNANDRRLAARRWLERLLQDGERGGAHLQQPSASEGNAPAVSEPAR